MQVGRYRVVRELGRGGMAAAFLGEAPDGQPVVLKVPLSDDATKAARLRDEARIGIRLAHPSLVETLDLFEHEGRPVLVVAFIDGLSVEDLRTRLGGPLPAPAVARIGWQIAQGLAALHGADDENGRPLGMVHRDVSAPNVLVDRGGDARLIDLGIARSVESLVPTNPDSIKGTVRYLPPEVFSGRPATPASDLWGLGCVLLEAATGRPSFSGTPHEVMAAVVGHDIMTRPEVAALQEGLRDILRQLLERDPERRAQDAGEVALKLRALGGEIGDGRDVLTSAIARVMAAGSDAPRPVTLAGGESPAGAPPVAPRQPPPPPPSTSTSWAPSPPAPPLPSLAPPRPPPRAGHVGLPPSPFETGASLELDDRRPRRPGRQLSATGAPPPRPKLIAERRGGGLKLVMGALAVVALAAGAVHVGRPLLEERARKKRDADTARAAKEDRLLLGGDSLPACWRGDEGWYFVYPGPDGSNVVAEHISEVPKRLRKKARCVKADR